MILPLCYYDDPVLRKKALKIKTITNEIKRLAEDLIESMIHYNGVGLAAPQVDKLLRIFVIRNEIVQSDGSYHFGTPEVILNPILSDPSPEMILMPEGCLSIPGVHSDVVRPAAIRVSYRRLDGEFVEEETSGFRARVFMHENDHLNGVLYFDRLTPERRKEIDSQLRAVKQKYSKQSELY